MVTKKDLVIAVLATFCLTVTIFMIMPIKSANNPYDPMLDYNHDGKIGLSDLVQFASSYGTTGDPTVNVNVTNWDQGCSVQTANEPTNLSYPVLFATLGPFYVGGYSNFDILIDDRFAGGVESSKINITLGMVSWSLSSKSLVPSFFDNPNIVVWSGYIHKGAEFVNNDFQIPTFKTKGPWMTFELDFSSTDPSGWLYFNTYLYTRND
jgi:hypothetical protein